MSTALLHYGANERRAIMLSKLGGKEVLQEATDKFYDRQIHDQRLMKFFQGTDLSILKWHQFNLMSIAFTHIPESFDARHLIVVRHERLFDQGLDETYFDVVMEHFEATLKEMQVDETLIAEALEVVKPLRGVFIEGREASQARKKSDAFMSQSIVLSSLALSLAGIAIVLSRISKQSTRA